MLPQILIVSLQKSKSNPSTKIKVRIYRAKSVTAGGRVLVLIQVASLCSGMPLSRDGLCTGVALRATGRDMLLGESAAISVPLNSDAQHPAPRDADTAAALRLGVSSVPAVCELLVSLREREFVPSLCVKKRSHTKWCNCIFWRRGRDSNPRVVLSTN